MRGWHRESARHSLAARGMAFRSSRVSHGTVSDMSNAMLDIAMANMIDAKNNLIISAPNMENTRIYVDEFLKNFELIEDNMSLVRNVDIRSAETFMVCLRALSEFNEYGTILNRPTTKDDILRLMDVSITSLETMVNVPQSRGIKKKYGKIPGGLSEGKKVDYDPHQLVMGQKIEMEHTKDPEVATEIAMDHLTEDPRYYTKLKRMEEGKCSQ